MKIISDGTSVGTKVLDSNGNEIEGLISKIDIFIEEHGLVNAVITFQDVELDLDIDDKDVTKEGN